MKPLVMLNVPLAAAFALAGCANTGNYTDSDYCNATLETTMARIVLTRAWGFLGGGAKLIVTDNGQSIGWVAARGKLCWDRHPGLTRVSVGTAAVAFGLQFDAEPGKTYDLTFNLEEGIKANFAKH